MGTVYPHVLKLRRGDFCAEKEQRGFAFSRPRGRDMDLNPISLFVGLNRCAGDGKAGRKDGK
jgi:hypothetical protein